MKRVLFSYAWLLATALFIGATACGGSDKPAQETADNWSADQAAADPNAPSAEQAAAPVPVSGLITNDEVKLGAIDGGLVAKGKGMYELKCQSCHSLGENKVVGPGWKGLSARREPAWIMNMIVHTEAMLDKDPEAQKMLEQCLVRMPNQSLSKEEAREVLEFIRANDKS